MDGTTETTMLAPPLVAPQRSPGSRHRWALLASVALMGAGAVAVMAAAGGSGADDPELGSREVGPVTSAVDDEPVPATTTATVDSTIASVRPSTTVTTTTSTSTTTPTSTSAWASSTTAPATTDEPATTTATPATAAPTTGATAPVTAPPPTEAPSTSAVAPACDPNHSGACVPIASDVDCAGGSGNGPAYVRGPVRVIGVDVYGLDADNDGIGCEDG